MSRAVPAGFEARLELGKQALGLGCVLLCIAIALAPTWHDLSLYGGHDWDEMSAHRLFTVKALREFGQLPLWMPYACGGFSEWGNVQGASNLVSPLLPAYLLLDLRTALRVELLASALIAAVGTWLLAGQLTRSAAARTFACLVFVVNGRFALQAATGHLWHLQYCYMPWAFWAFQSLLRAQRLLLVPLTVGGLAVAAMVYGGGIYPLPHTALLLAAYAGLCAALEKKWFPLLALSSMAALAVGLSAPKLFPVLLDFGERPRLVPSTEAIDLDVLWQSLVAPNQTPGSRPAPIPQWGWHEYGMYIGWVPALLLGLGLFAPAPRRELALRATAALAVALGFGAFHAFAPWTLLHQVSLFRSQHVPTRWLYPAILLLGVTTAASLGRLQHRAKRLPHLELLLLGACLLLAVDIGREARLPLSHAFWMRAEPVRPASAFVQLERAPRSLQYQRRDYAPEALPAMMAGVGVLRCTLNASLNVWAPRGEDQRPLGMGARGRGARDYRGEAYFPHGPGSARIVSFSPARVVVEVEGARPGDLLVLNQNFDPGWSVEGRAAESFQDAVATRVTAGEQRLAFSFWPRGLSAGLAALALTLALLGWLYWRRASAAALSP